MDPVSALTGTTAISSNCARCVYTLTKWLSQTKHAHASLHKFKDEVLALQLTYERLSACLQDPIMVKAARKTDQQAGGNLWSQMMNALYDCLTTILLVNQTFDNVDKFSRRTSTIIKQVTESLISGELSKARHAVQLFDTHLTLPLLMINVSLQAADYTVGDTRHRQLWEDLAELQDLIKSFQEQVEVVHSVNVGFDAQTYKHMEAFIGSLLCYLDVATAHLGEDDKAKLRSRTITSASQDLQVVDIWMEQDLSAGNPAATSAPDPSHVSRTTPSITFRAADNEDLHPHENDIELELITEYITNGQSDLDIGDFSSADDNFRHALDVATEHNLSCELPDGLGGIMLMLADCYLRQDKEENAIELLESVAEGAFTHRSPPKSEPVSRSTPDMGEQIAALTASNTLATVLLKHQDFSNAEKRAKEAFKGRRRLLGGQHSMTLKSVDLLIAIYIAKEDNINARAYRRFLDPSKNALGGVHALSIRSASSLRSTPDLDHTRNSNEPLQTTPNPLQLSHPETIVEQRPPSLWEDSPLLSHGPDIVLTPEFSGELCRRSESSVSDVQSAISHSSILSSIEPDPLPPNIGLSPGKMPTWKRSISRIGLRSREVSHSEQLTRVSLSMLASQNSSKTVVACSSNRSVSDVSSTGHRSQRSQPYTPPTPWRMQELDPLFKAIRVLRQEGKAHASVDLALKVLRAYDPDCHILLTREIELKKNMKESHKGLAATGHGYSPIHFFAEQKFPATAEIQLLIQHGADVNAVAFKAAMPGTDPFTPLQRAIERGHPEIVKLLLASPHIHLTPPRVPKKFLNGSFDLETLQPLLLACAKGRIEITSDLLQAGIVDVLRKTNPFPARMWHGNSLLHEACWLGNAEMITMLLDYQVSRRQQRYGSPGDTRSYQTLSDLDMAFEESIIGLPGQIDQFGVTPIMYAVDIRDCTTDSMRTHKLNSRTRCLRIVLEHDILNTVDEQTYRTSVAQILSAKWSRGPGKDHSIFCYAEETGDDELNQLVDQFRYSISARERCAAQRRCSAERLYDGQVIAKEVDMQTDSMDWRGLTALPSLAQLMDSTVGSESPDLTLDNSSRELIEVTLVSPLSLALDGSNSAGGIGRPMTPSGSSISGTSRRDKWTWKPPASNSNASRDFMQATCSVTKN